MDISAVTHRLYLGTPYPAGPIAPIAAVPAAAGPAAGRRMADAFEPSAAREALPRVTYGPGRSAYPAR